MPIAFNSASTHTSNGVNAFNVNYATAGSDRFLIATVRCQSGTTCSSVTYNGVSLTQLSTPLSIGSTFDKFYCFYLIAPATGTNTLSFSFSHQAAYAVCFSSYTGVDQTNPINVYASKVQTVSTISDSVTTTVNSCWVVSSTATGDGSGSVAVVSGLTLRSTSTWAISLGDSNSAVEPPGAYSVSWGTGSDKRGIWTLGITPADGGSPLSTFTPKVMLI